MLALKITQIGNSVGIVLPKEAVSRLKVEKGDVVYLTEAADGYTDVVLNRRAPDLCKALVAEGVELAWSFETLGLGSNARLRLLNPQTL